MLNLRGEGNSCHIKSPFPSSKGEFPCSITYLLEGRHVGTFV